MSIYGEGLYRDADGKLVEDATRGAGASSLTWDPLDSAGRPLTPLATPEWKRPNLASVYAITKFVQERLTLTVTAAYGMEGVALRLFNVYGPGQALSNPYTGVSRFSPLVSQTASRRSSSRTGGSGAISFMSRMSREAFALALGTPESGGRGLQYRQRAGAHASRRSRG